MKENTLPARIHLLVNNVVDILIRPEEPTKKIKARPNPPLDQHTRPDRKKFSYYQAVFDDETRELVGHLADISSGGFKLDSQKPIPINKDIRFYLKLTSEVADKPFMVFVARSKWCKIDPLDPCAYNVGYQLIHIAPGDLEIFNRMMESYGTANLLRNIDLRRSNKW